MPISSRVIVWSLLLTVTLGGCWRRRHRYARTRAADTTETTSRSYDQPPPPAPTPSDPPLPDSPPPPSPPPPPPSSTTQPHRSEDPIASEGSPTLISRFRPTRGNRCDNPKTNPKANPKASPTTSEGDSFVVQGVDSTDVLNVRVEPDWRSQVIGKLPPDMRGVIGLPERQRVGTATWRKIACGTVSGWVNEKFLERETAAR